MSTRSPQSADAFTIPKAALRRLGMAVAAVIVLAAVILAIVLVARGSGSRDTLFET